MGYGAEGQEHRVQDIKFRVYFIEFRVWFMRQRYSRKK